MILLGDSAVGKTKMVERYLDDEFNPRQVIEPPARPRAVVPVAVARARARASLLSRLAELTADWPRARSCRPTR